MDGHLVLDALPHTQRIALRTYGNGLPRTGGTEAKLARSQR